MAGDFSALVALRAKQGEFTALDEWDRVEQIRSVQPLLELEPSSSPRKQFAKVEEVARKLHQHGRHLMIDASDVAHVDGFGNGPAGALGELADRLDGPADLLGDYPVPFEPVVRCGLSNEELPACANLCEELGLGAAVRFRPAEDTKEDLDRVLDKLRLDTPDLDLIIDLQYVPEVTAAHTDRALKALRTVTTAGPFRSTTLLSGSIPPSLKEVSSPEQPRTEEALWRLLNEEGSLELRLGDYGVVHPGPSTGFRSKHVSLKYSTSGRWAYSRQPIDEATGDATTESPRAATLRAICRDLVDSDHYSGTQFSWGDREIATASHDRGTKWGLPSRPVALATSHHLAYLTAQTATAAHDDQR
ncbi:hypothetical protein ACFQ16_10450 [Saccharopolyspora rosea]|uniref:T4 beta protein n=1 Tax=Saccharopolyspora rosea TaxID=524884 RepID=A0ABW3FNQ3_9PSEU